MGLIGHIRQIGHIGHIRQIGPMERQRDIVLVARVRIQKYES